jgi:GTPase SAR1 family protein
LDLLYDQGTIDALSALKAATADLAKLMNLDSRSDIDAWIEALDTRLLPRLKPGFPLTVAICGGGSAGKSTLFNALVGETVSPTGGRAGINRRLLIALGAEQTKTPGVVQALFEPFGCLPQPLIDMDQLTTPGDPLLYSSRCLPAELALLDTPDFDTGAGGSYQNREMAERSLRAADVLVYIFTNANYNNRDNTDFIARMLTAVGTRNCFLVYRVYPAFSEQEILEHAHTVARNIYGDRAQRHVLGVYRAGEDNRVAAGQQPMALLPVPADRPALMAVLAGMDPRQVKGDLHRSIFKDVLRQGGQFLQQARESRDHLSLYLEGLRTVQQRSVQDALGHLPMDSVVRRFSQIWQDTDPAHVKIMRTTGRVVETPLRLLMGAARWFGGSRAKPDTAQAGTKMRAAMEADLVRAANRLRKAVVDPAILLELFQGDPAVASLKQQAQRLAGSVGVSQQPADEGMIRFQIPHHPAMTADQAALRNTKWSAAVDDMLARREGLLGLTSQLEAELQRLAHEQRARMTTFDQIRQTFSAMLNIIPATAAVTYVLHTGDPVGAAGIKVKLAGLFGLNDLYALVAIPATAGMKKADLKQLEALLAPVARAWLMHKLKAIEALFEEKITGRMLQTGQALLDASAGRVAIVTDSLTRCGQALERRP